MFRKIRKKGDQKYNLQNCQSVIVSASAEWGDSTMMLPFFRVLRENAQKAEITFLNVNNIAGESLLRIGVIDRFIKIPDEIAGIKKMVLHPIRLLRFVIHFKMIRYDLAVNTIPSFSRIILLRLFGAAYYFGYCERSWSFLLDSPILNWETKGHYVDRFLYILEEMGCKINDNQRIPVIAYSNAILDSGRKFINEYNLKNKFIIGIHPGANNIKRKWPYYKPLIHNLLQNKKIIIFLFSGPSEKEEVENILNDIKEKERIFLIKVGLEKLPVYISICNLLIGNDSGFSHFGAAYGKDVIQIRGIARGSKTGAKGNGQIFIMENLTLDCREGSSICSRKTRTCPKGTYECLTYTKVDDVLKLVCMQMKKHYLIYAGDTREG